VCEPRGCRRWRAEEYGRWIPPVPGTCSTFDETSQECVVDYLTEAGGFLLGRNQENFVVLAECHSTSTPLSTSSLRAPSMSENDQLQTSERVRLDVRERRLGRRMPRPHRRPDRDRAREPGGVSWTTRYSSGNAVS
jgi:hypothetical protein